MIYLAVLNVLIWSYAILTIIRSRAVTFECRAGYTWIVIVLAAVGGGVFYFREPSYPTLFTYTTFFIASCVIYACKNGFSDKGIVILGRIYPYHKIKDITIKKRKKRIDVEIALRYKTVFLFCDPIEELNLRSVIKKYYN